MSDTGKPRFEQPQLTTRKRKFSPLAPVRISAERAVTTGEVTTTSAEGSGSRGRPTGHIPGVDRTEVPPPSPKPGFILPEHVKSAGQLSPLPDVLGEASGGSVPRGRSLDRPSSAEVPPPSPSPWFIPLPEVAGGGDPILSIDAYRRSRTTRFSEGSKAKEKGPESALQIDTSPTKPPHLPDIPPESRNYINDMIEKLGNVTQHQQIPKISDKEFEALNKYLNHYAKHEGMDVNIIGSLRATALNAYRKTKYIDLHPSYPEEWPVVRASDIIEARKRKRKESQIGSDEEVKEITFFEIDAVLKENEHISEEFKKPLRDIAKEDERGKKIIYAWRALEETDNEILKGMMKKVIEKTRPWLPQLGEAT